MPSNAKRKRDSAQPQELDGARHFGELGVEYEAERTAFLEGQGIEVIRFENRVVYQNIEAVLDTIREAIRNRGV